MTTVYYGPFIGSHDVLLSTPFEPLSKVLKEEPDFSGKSSAYKCPALINSIKNTYVVRAPYDVDVVLGRAAAPVVRLSSTGEIIGEPSRDSVSVHKDLVQMYETLWFIIADKPCTVHYTPPYYHKTPFYGFSGVYDAYQWPRHISIASRFDREFSVKRGDPVAYVKFTTEDNKLRLKHTSMPDSINPFYQQNHISAVRGKPLSYWYEKRKQTGLNKKAIRIIEQHVKECS